MPIDADILRVIFTILGSVLILGIYIWERIYQDVDGPGETGWQSSYPRIMDSVVPPNLTWKPNATVQNAELDQALQALSGLVTEDRSPALEGMDLSNEAILNTQSLLNPNRVNDTDDYWYTSTQDFILQIIIGAKGGQFHGSDILRVAERIGFKADDTGILQYHANLNGQDILLFTMVSIVKPGIFPIQALENFQTPGLAIFTQLPVPVNGVGIFNTMLSHARSIAAELKGEIQDETRSRLTNQTIEHIRSQIIEYERQIRISNRRQEYQGL